MLKFNSYKLLVILAITGLVLALGVIGFLLMQGNAKNEFSASSSEAKEPAPNFALVLLDGKSFQFSEHRGKPVLINFFASWCLPCREEMPGLDKTAEIQKSFGLYGIPTTYFIDRNGIINYSHSGVVTEELLQYELDKLL